MKPQARVLVLVNSLDLGGTQINAVDFAYAMQGFGYDSLLVGRRDPSNPDQSLLEVAAARSVRIEVLDFPPTTLAAARTLTALTNRYRADLVHTYGAWNARFAFWGPNLFDRIPLVMTVYEMFVPSSVYPSPNLIVGTRYLLESLVDRPGPVHLISPPVDLTEDDSRRVSVDGFLRMADLATEHVRVVIVSRLSEEMKAVGVELAMRAVERLGMPDVALVIVGTGDAEGRLRRISEEINRAMGRRAIVLTGSLVDPRPAYASADVVVGMGGSAARGLAFGKPLVVVGENGWSGIFTPESATALFRDSFWSPERVTEPMNLLCDNLRPLVVNATLRQELGRFGRKFAETNFGLESMAARLATVYAEALRRRRQRRSWLRDLVSCEVDPAKAWLSRKLFLPQDALTREAAVNDTRSF